MTKRTRKTKTEVQAEVLAETTVDMPVAEVAVLTDTLGDAAVDQLDWPTEGVAVMALEMTEPTDDALESVVATLDASDEAVSVIPATETVQEGEAEVPTGEKWNTALASLTDEEITTAALTVAKAMDDRAEFEESKDSGNGNIQRTLKKARAQLATKRAAAAMLVSGFNEAQINRSVHAGARYNVYALGKLADVIYAVSGGAVNNAINNAICRSLFKFHRAKVAFTMDMAKAAASDKIKVESAVKGLFVRHTVSASTAPTQASSTMQALVDLGVVSRAGSERNPIFSLTDAPIVEKLQAVLQAA